MRKIIWLAIISSFSIAAMNEATQAKYERFISNVGQACRFLQNTPHPMQRDCIIKQLTNNKGYVERKMEFYAQKLEKNPKDETSFEIYDLLRTAQVYLDNTLRV